MCFSAGFIELSSHCCSILLCVFQWYICQCVKALGSASLKFLILENIASSFDSWNHCKNSSYWIVKVSVMGTVASPIHSLSIFIPLFLSAVFMGHVKRCPFHWTNEKPHKNFQGEEIESVLRLAQVFPCELSNCRLWLKFTPPIQWVFAYNLWVY